MLFEFRVGVTFDVSDDNVLITFKIMIKELLIRDLVT